MSVAAYILIQTEVGKTHVARQAAAVEGVTSAEDVTGPYDVIVRAESESMDDLGRLVVGHIHRSSRASRAQSPVPWSISD